MQVKTLNTFIWSLCLGLCFSLSAWAQDFELGQDVLIQDQGKWCRAWIVKVLEGPRYLIAKNWNAGRMEIVSAERLRANTRSPLPADKKQVTGWTSTKTGLWQHRDFQEALPASLDNFILPKSPEASSAKCHSPAELLDIAEQTLSSGAPHHHHLQATEAQQKTPWPSKAEALCWFLRPHEYPEKR